jgi:8-oxo-dGTP diphosphatase
MKREYPKAPVTAVSGVIFDDAGRVLLIQRGREPAKGKWSLPGGVVQLGETLEDAVRREILEECGLMVYVGCLLSASSRIVKDAEGRVQFHYILLDYFCRPMGGDLKAGSDASDVLWVKAEDVGSYDLTEGVFDVIRKGLDERRK